MIQRLFSEILSINPYKSLILGSLVLLVFSCLGLTKVSFNSDSRVFFSENNEQIKQVALLEDEFTKNDTIVFLIDSNDGDVFNQHTLNAIYSITESLWGKPLVTTVNSLTHFKRTRLINDTIETAPLYLPERDSNYNELKQYAATEERLIGSILGPDLSTTAIVATLNIDRKSKADLDRVNEWATTIESDLNALLPHDSIYIVGTAAYNLALVQATNNELTTKVPVLALILVVVLFLLFRDIKIALAALYLIVVSGLVVFSFSGWLSIPLTPVIGFVPLALFAIVLADTVHIVSSYVDNVKKSPDKSDAIRLTLQENIRPISLTTLTTTIGFLCLLVSESPPYVHLGALCAIGSVVAFVVAAIWFPSWITLISPGQGVAFKDKQYLAMAVKRPLISIMVVSIVLMAGCSFVDKNYLDERIDLFFDDTWNIKKGSDILNSKLSGIHRIEYRVEATNNYPLFSPGYIQAIRSFRKWAESQPIVATTSGIDQIIYTAFKNIKSHETEQFPQNQQAIAQLFMMYELSLPYGASLSEYINFDKSASRIKLVLYSSSSKEIIAFERQANQWINTHWPIELRSQSVSLEAAFAELNLQNSKSLMLSTLVGFIIIGTVLVGVFRSFKLGMVSIFSNSLPALFAFGIWGLIDGQVGLAVSIVTIITLGIVVDDTIHILAKFQMGISKGMAPEHAARYTLATTGKAIVVTTVILCLCFGTLAFSHFKPNADLGFMSATTLAAALIIDILLLLPLIVIFHQRYKTG